MHAGHGLRTLSERCQQIALTLLADRSVQRLAYIRQLGFSPRKQQARLEHTFDSVELVAALMQNAPNVTEHLRAHVIAAVALDDIGRAPFSNSLDPIFKEFAGFSGDAAPIDVSRSISVIRHLEAKERLVSSLGLSTDVVCSLLAGEIPWDNGGWLRQLLDGPLDIDRLSYVRGDFEHLGGKEYETRELIKGILINGSAEQTIIDSGSLEAAIDFLFHRAWLFQEIYHDPIKLALEEVTRLLLEFVWNFAPVGGVDWSDAAKPSSIGEFLLWTDVTVLKAFTGDKWKSAPYDLRALRDVVYFGGLQVAELRRRDTPIVDLDAIDALLDAVASAVSQRRHCWLLRSEDLPSLRVYTPKSLIVRQRRTFAFLDRFSPDIRALAIQRERSPLLVFPTTDFAVVQNIIHSAGLEFWRVLPLPPLELNTAAQISRPRS